MKDLKCQCDDGINVHPWECCSTGACNVFCCNCGGPCRIKNDTAQLSYPDGHLREKREILRSLPSLYHDPAQEQNNIEAVNVSE